LERARLLVACGFAILMATVIFPVVSGWTFGGGFLTRFGYQDVAGAGPIHVCSGFAAIMGAIFTGARLGRFDALSLKKDP